MFKDKLYIEEILDGMYDWVRVLDCEDNIIYANKSMRDALCVDPKGKKCYELLNRLSPCENCISRKTVFTGQSHQKEEVIDDKTFSVMSSPIRDENNKISAVVEVLRDVTNIKKLDSIILAQNKQYLTDLSLSRKIQYGLLPQCLETETYKYSYIYRPCNALGGDFLDFFPIDEDKYGIYIADVQGHGIPSSLLTVFVKYSLDKNILQPSLALKKLFDEFNKNMLEPTKYITIFYAIVDFKIGTITYSNAGHSVSPVLFSNDSFNILRTPGIPISSWIDIPSYTDKIEKFMPGDKLFLHTDGLMETRNPSGEQFGEDRLLDHLNPKNNHDDIINSIYTSAKQFSQVKWPDGMTDDVTLSLLSFKQQKNP